jgi:hypothetical protein
MSPLLRSASCRSRYRFPTFKTVRRIPLRSVALAVLAIAATLAAFAPSAQADPLFGPIMAYDGFDDSPLSTMSFSYFHLIKMTDLPSNGAFTAPGVTLSPGFPTSVILGPGGLIDSVDGENAGHSLFSGNGAAGLTFTFDKTVLGSLPTAVGIAWTDGVRLIHFSAVDGNGNSLGQIDDNTCCDFNSGDGNSDNYRLFYAIDPLGISSIHISNDGGGIEVDHLQYGLLSPTAVPEPSTIAFTLFTAGVLLTRSARRRLRS